MMQDLSEQPESKWSVMPLCVCCNLKEQCPGVFGSAVISKHMLESNWSVMPWCACCNLKEHCPGVYVWTTNNYINVPLHFLGSKTSTLPEVVSVLLIVSLRCLLLILRLLRRFRVATWTHEPRYLVLYFSYTLELLLLLFLSAAAIAAAAALEDYCFVRPLLAELFSLCVDKQNTHFLCCRMCISQHFGWQCWSLVVFMLCNW